MESPAYRAIYLAILPTRSTLSRMASFGWSDRPPSVDAQVCLLLDGVEDAVKDDLIGVYLHGSLVFGCCNPLQSDLDLLVVVRDRLRANTRRAIDSAVRAVSRRPLPLEISVLAEPTLRSWRHPARYELHYSERYRLRESPGPGADPDLAAHLTVARERGVALIGPPPRQCLPKVPWHDYVLAILDDFKHCSEQLTRTYAILSMSRVWATLATHELHSKESGALWAMAELEDPSIVADALESYRIGASREFAADVRLSSYKEVVGMHVEALRAEE